MERDRLQPGPKSLAAPLAAVLGCLQPGIDPVFLALLSDACHVPAAAHGIIVGGTQAGAALGSLLVWRLGTLLPHRALIAGAAGATVLSMGTALADGLAAALVLRCGYGLAMGMVYAHAMSAYAARQPNKAYGSVFLVQLLLSTLVSLILPELAVAFGARAALAALALAPAGAFVALRAMYRGGGNAADRVRDDIRAPIPRAGWALAAATFWFICSTMLVWSFAAALAADAGIDERTIGHAVALGSLAGALTALAVMREKLVVPLLATAVIAGAFLAAPILLTQPGDATAFVVSIVLLNIGSTAIIIRCSGLATATSSDSRFRTFVACTHSLGLIAGPTVGSAMMAWAGADGLLVGLSVTLSGGVAAVVFANLSTTVSADAFRRWTLRSTAGHIA